MRRHHRANHGVVRLAIAGHRRIQVDEPLYAGRHLLRNSRDDGTAIAVTNKDHMVQVLVFEQTDEIRNVRVEVYLATQQVCSLTEPGQRRRDHRVTGGTQVGCDIPPAPAAEPCTRDKQEHRHGRTPLTRSSKRR